MEYQGQGWLDPNSNRAYAQARVSTDEHPLCPVCEMDVDKATAPRSSYEGQTFYFCSEAHKSTCSTRARHASYEPDGFQAPANAWDGHAFAHMLACRRDWDPHRPTVGNMVP